MKIRFARIDDFAEILKIEKLCFGDNAYDDFTIKNLLISENTITLVATVNSKIVGYAAAIYHSADAKLCTIDVHPDYQRKGIGSALLDKIEILLKNKNIRMIDLEVSVHNRSAIAFYKKANYEITNRIKKYYQNGSDAFVMQKWLRKS
jgi:ribosomal-protein-alanine N-acetyltransferase